MLHLRDMPKDGSQLSLDFSSLLGPLFYTWLSQMLLPVMVGLLVYEKEKNLRVMMKMQGLADPSYWRRADRPRTRHLFPPAIVLETL